MDNLRTLLGNSLIDTHCHLNDTSYDETRANVLAEIEVAGVAKVIDIAVDLPSAQRVLDLADAHATLIPSVGIDPECLVPGSDLYRNIDDFNAWLAESMTNLTNLASAAEVIGECGIDVYWLHRQVRDGKLSKLELDQSVTKQEHLFRAQCELAAHLNLPMSIHSRGAEAKCLEILSDYSVTAIFHSYTGGLKVAKRILDKGHFLGINGIITYTSAQQLRDMYVKLLGNAENTSPVWFYDKQVVFETDGPFLHPFDASKRNTPAQVKTIYDYVVGLVTQ